MKKAFEVSKAALRSLAKVKSNLGRGGARSRASWGGAQPAVDSDGFGEFDLAAAEEQGLVEAGRIDAATMTSLRRNAERTGLGVPAWLDKGIAPEFKTVEGGQKGPELLLLHGLLGALSNWEAVFPLFGAYSKPIALQLPILNAKSSDVKIGPLSIHTELFIRQRQLAPVAVCGNSLGGHVALRLCLAAPELVDCMILTGTSGLYEHTVDALPIRPDKSYVREHMGRVFCQQRFVTEEAIDEIHAILNTRTHVINLIQAARSAKKDNLLNRLPEIKVPTLLLWGEDDKITTMDVAESFHKNIPNSELVTVPNCGHAPMIEHPEWFAEQVKNFLKKHSRVGL